MHLPSTDWSMSMYLIVVCVCLCYLRHGLWGKCSLTACSVSPSQVSGAVAQVSGTALWCNEGLVCKQLAVRPGWMSLPLTTLPLPWETLLCPRSKQKISTPLAGLDDKILSYTDILWANLKYVILRGYCDVSCVLQGSPISGLVKES